MGNEPVSCFQAVRQAKRERFLVMSQIQIEDKEPVLQKMRDFFRSIVHSSS